MVLPTDAPTATPARPASDQVRDALRSQLGVGDLDVAVVAAALGTGPRTLQRRLREEGTSYGALLDAVRRERAEVLVADRRLTLCDVAVLLGLGQPGDAEPGRAAVVGDDGVGAAQGRPCGDPVLTLS